MTDIITASDFQRELQGLTRDGNGNFNENANKTIEEFREELFSILNVDLEEIDLLLKLTILIREASALRDAGGLLKDDTVYRLLSDFVESVNGSVFNIKTYADEDMDKITTLIWVAYQCFGRRVLNELFSVDRKFYYNQLSCDSYNHDELEFLTRKIGSVQQLLESPRDEKGDGETA